jgi:long-subunit fatty acid transport protein
MKPMNRIFWAFVLLCLGVCGFNPNALAQGFEKNGMWDAHAAALAGSGVASIGADSLYFNPAGLTGFKPGGELSANFSEVTSQTQGVFNNNNDGVSSRQITTPTGGILSSYTFDDKLAVGAGYYAVGGGKFYYDGLNYAGFVGGPLSAYSDLAITEMAVGASYRVDPKLSFGMTLR